MRLDDAFQDATERTLRLSLNFRDLLYTMRDAMAGQPIAQHYEVVASGRSEVWCWRHERPVLKCQQEAELCTGEAIDVNDPTGEAAVNYDRARADHRQLSRDVRTLGNIIDRLERLQLRYTDAKITNDRAGIGTCEDCHRYADGRKLRLSCYKGGPIICPACRGVRDRSAAPKSA